MFANKKAFEVSNTSKAHVYRAPPFGLDPHRVYISRHWIPYRRIYNKSFRSCHQGNHNAHDGEISWAFKQFIKTLATVGKIVIDIDDFFIS